MSDLSASQAHSLRLKIVDLEGNIAESTAERDRYLAMLGEDKPEPGPVEPASVLPPLPGPLQENNWSNPMAPSSWSEPKLGGYPWSAGPANVRLDDKGQLHLSVTEKASAQVQFSDAAFTKEGRFAFDVTFPKMRPGLIAALWTYNNKTTEEIDFEVVGNKGLTVTVWANVKGEHVAVWNNGGKPIVDGDVSGRRFLLEIDYSAGKHVAFIVDGKEVARATPANSQGRNFPVGTQKAYMDLWVAEGTHPDWAGKWEPMGEADSRTMTVHGFKQS